MVRYYDLNKNEITQNWKSEIPSEFLVKKNWLPIERADVKDDVEEYKNKSFTLEVLEDKVIQTFYSYYKEPTLEELKVSTYENIKNYGTQYILNKYSLPQQVSAQAVLNGFSDLYTSEEAQGMLSYANSKAILIKSKKELCENAESKEELEEIYTQFKEEL
jgi:hypothetical protein